MRAIKKTRLYIEHHPDSEAAKLLARLVLSLERETEFPVSDLYRLDFDRFKLALNLLDEWRLDRYYAGKGRLFDVSFQMHNMQLPEAETSTNS